MSETKRDYNVIQPVDGAQPEIGRWLWSLEDTRAGTLAMLKGLDEAALDWKPTWALHSIGTLLYHIALVEIDWLVIEVQEKPETPEALGELTPLFPHDSRDSAGKLTFVTGESLDQHLQRLAVVRRELLDVYKAMSLDDFRRARGFPSYDVTPEWVLHHLNQHEAEHHSEIAALRTAFLLG